MDEQALWLSFLEGNQDAFQSIYSRYYQNLYSYGVRKTNRPELVRDCVQDLFVNLWASRKNLSPTNNIKYYLLASLRNLLVRASIMDDKWDRVASTTDNIFQLEFNPEAEYIRKENLSKQATMIMEALDQLTPRQKEVLYLRYFEELSYEQIADLLDISVKGVYKLSYRAIDALKIALNLPKTDILLLLALYRAVIFS
jgi:RNA polymerase sigma factor (sigma-70 family)